MRKALLYTDLERQSEVNCPPRLTHMFPPSRFRSALKAIPSVGTSIISC